MARTRDGPLGLLTVTGRLRTLPIWVPAAIALAGAIVYVLAAALDERMVDLVIRRRATATMHELARGAAGAISDLSSSPDAGAALRVVEFTASSSAIDDAYLADEHGRPVARRREHAARIGLAPPLEEARPEVRQVFAGGTAESTRVVVTPDHRVIAVAPVRWAGARTLWFVVRSDYNGSLAAARALLHGKAIATLALGALLLLALAAVLHARVTRPAMRLANAASRLAAGDRTTRTGISGNDELGRAGRAFDHMADAIARAEDELRRLREQLDALLQNMPVGVMAVNRSDRSIAFHNRTFDELYGVSLSLGQNLDDLLPQVRLERGDGSAFPTEELSIRQVERTGEPVDLNDLVYVHADGTRVPVLVRAVPVCREGGGEFDTVLVIAQDRRELERALEERRETQRMFDAVLRSLPVGVVVIARDSFRLLYANPKWTEIHGASLAPGTDLRPALRTMRGEYPDGRPYPTDQLGAPTVMRTGQPAEVRDIVHVRPDGTRVPILINAVPAQIGDGPEFDAVVSVVQDRRELKGLLAEIREWERRYEKVVGATDQVIYEWDLVRDVEEVSDNRVATMGPPAPENGQSIRDRWAARVHADDRERAVRALDASLADGRAFDCEYRYLHSDDRYVVIHDRGFFDLDETGRPVRMYGAMADVTERHRLEQQLRQAQKMETVGTLAGGVAHDFNNQLTAVLGHLDLLALEMPAEDPGQEHVRIARLAAERCSQLTRGLLAFSRQIESRRRPLELDPVVEETLQILRRVIPSAVELITDLRSHGVRVPLDPLQMQQVVFNLCVNARDAMPEGGELELATRRVRVDHVSQRPAGARPGEFVELAVRDSGAGIPPAALPRVFEPFFTTKPVGEGTGLGLAMVYGIVQKHEGWIEVESTLGQGTTFRIYLPLASAATPVEPTPPPAAPIEPSGRGEWVLVVDDEPAICDLATLALEQGGYRVASAGDGSAALRWFREHRREVRVVLLDLVMPGLSAGSILQEMRAVAPDVAVVLSSGHVLHEAAAGLPVDARLPKPYTAVDLVRTVRDLLAGPLAGSS